MNTQIKKNSPFILRFELNFIKNIFDAITNEITVIPLLSFTKKNLLRLDFKSFMNSFLSWFDMKIMKRSV